MSVSKTLRDIKAGRQVHGCMGAMAHGHSHHESDEVDEIIKNPEELTFEFTLEKIERRDEHEQEVWSMNKEEQTDAWPKYESALKCIDLLITSNLKPTAEMTKTKMILLNN